MIRVNPFVLVLCACPLVAGCITVDPVYLKDAEGHTVQCGPYSKLANIPMENEATEMKMRACISKLQLQGYDRVAAPG
jgi:hypothetical protein